MSERNLLVEERKIASGKIEIWTVNRPKVLNALSADVLKEIDEAGRQLEKKLGEDILHRRALVITGAGEKAFVAGADIAGMKTFSPTDAEAFARFAQRAFTRLEQLPIPTIAAVNGFALGGGMELSSACDIIVASKNAEFGQPEVFLGLIPGFGGNARFVDRLGVNKALELLYTGRRIKADEALRLGLIQSISPEGQSALDAAVALSEECTVKSAPLALAAMKRVVRSRTAVLFDDVQNLEAEAFRDIFTTKDAIEGVTAFTEKRKANFTGT